MAKAYNIKTNTKEDFFNRITKFPNGCWEFESHSDRNGYRFFQFEGKDWRAHRLSMVFAGKDPTGKVVCHHCDNPPCVNPDHLFIGSPKDNNDDRIKKGRSKGGPKYYSPYAGKGKGLPLEIIQKIQSTEGTLAYIASVCGVSKDTVKKYKKLIPVPR